MQRETKILDEDLSLELIQDVITNCVDSLMEEGDSIEVGFIALGVKRANGSEGILSIPMGSPEDLINFMDFLQKQGIRECAREIANSYLEALFGEVTYGKN